MKNKKVLYFGYGANAHKDMVRALIGRVPKGFKAKLTNYGLFIQTWPEIPKKVKKILQDDWDEKFSSYIAVPLKNTVVWGTAWELTKEERAIIGNWELHNMWYTPIKIKVMDRKGNVLEAETEIVKKYSTKKKAIQVENYNNFPVDKRKILRVARKDRKEFLEKLKK